MPIYPLAVWAAVEAYGKMKAYRIYFHRSIPDPNYCLRCYLSVKATDYENALLKAKKYLKEEDEVVAIIDITKVIVLELKDYQCKS